MDEFLTILYERYFDAKSSLTQARNAQKGPLSSVGDTIEIVDILKHTSVDKETIMEIDAKVREIITRGNEYQTDQLRVVIDHCQANLNRTADLIVEFMDYRYEKIA